jgi:hypothetical protein
MATWQDAAKRTWTIKITGRLLESVKEATGIDLVPDNNNTSAVASLLLQSRKLGGVLWECHKTVATEARAISQADFFDSLDGPALKSGWGALVDAVVEFHAAISPDLGSAIRESIDAQIRAEDAATEQLIKTIKSEATDQAIQKYVKQLGEKMQAEVVKALK